MDDHRVAVDIGERLAGQAGRGHAGRDEDDGAIGHGRILGKTAKRAGEAPDNKSQSSRLIRVASRAGKLVVSAPAGRLERFQSLRPGGCLHVPGRRSPRPAGRDMLRSGLTMDSSNSTRSPVRCSATGLGVMALSIVSEAIYAPAGAGQARLRDRPWRDRRRGRRQRAAPAAAAVAPIAEPPADARTRPRARPRPRSAWPATRSDKGEPNKVGPNLYGVVGAPIIHPETGFKYSAGHVEDKGKTASPGPSRISTTS